MRIAFDGCRGCIPEGDGSLQDGMEPCLSSRRETSMCSPLRVTIFLGLLADTLAVSVGWLAAFATSGIASKYGSNQQREFDINPSVVCWHLHSYSA